ncbi:MAG: extracellular solute-binding protein [Anaerolineales bacterium]|nr:extracellular solute-binding protein [Anaerolineales bacterium]
MSSRVWKLTIFILLLLSMVFLASCAEETETAPAVEPTTPPEPTEVPEEVQLEVWVLSQSPEEIENFETMSEVFAESHPGVSVVVSPYSWEAFNNTIKLALDSGTGPDLAYGQPGPLGHVALAEAGHLVDLTPYVTELGWDTTHPEGARTYWAKDPADPVYAMPFDITNVGVFYNVELFEANGWEPPTTWEEFQTLLADIKAAGITPFSCGATSGWTFDHYFQALVHVTVPIDDIAKVYKLEAGPSYTDDVWVQAATIVNDWVEAGYFNEGFMGMAYEDQNNLFITEQVAMNLGGTWNNSTFIAQPEFTAGFFRLPKINPDIDHHSMVTPNNAWYISTYTEHLDLSVAYVDFMLGLEMAEAKWAAGDIPDYIFDVVPDPVARLQADVYAAAQGVGIGYYFTDNPELMEAEWAAIQAMGVGDLTPEEAMAQIDEVFQRLVEESQ